MVHDGGSAERTAKLAKTMGGGLDRVGGVMGHAGEREPNRPLRL